MYYCEIFHFMNKILIFLYSSCMLLIGLNNSANAQLFKSNENYLFKSGADHLGIFGSLGVNLPGNKVTNDYGSGSLKGGTGIVLLLGPQYQYHFSRTFFIRGAIQLGIISHAFKFKETLKSRSDSLWIEYDDKYTRKSIAPIVLSPKIEFGKQFIGNKLLFEVAVGGSFEKYLNRNIDHELEKVVTKTTLSNRDVVDVEVANKKYFGLGQWGGFNAELYLGFRRMDFNDFMRRLSFGLNFIYSTDKYTVGYAEVLTYNLKYQYPISRQNFYMLNMAVTFKIAYDIF